MAVATEATLLAATIFLLFGIDELLVDLLWFVVRERDRPLAHFAVPGPLRFAVIVPAWREAAVIGAMLRLMLARWADADIRVYCAAYANDPATLRAVRAVARRDARVRIVLNPRPGPTTKGDGLNHGWRAIEADAARGDFIADAVLLHDAEDVVDSDELAVLATALRQSDYAQLPVVPLAEGALRWVEWHYADEFACAHRRDMVVRHAVGAPLPTAGVGCAFRVDALRAIASGAGPFAPDCLTEDYDSGCGCPRWAIAAVSCAFAMRVGGWSPRAAPFRRSSYQACDRRRGGFAVSRWRGGTGWGGRAAGGRALSRACWAGGCWRATGGRR